MRSYWYPADGIYAICYSAGVDGYGDPGDNQNLLIYLREIDDPEKYYRHIASLADPYKEATFDVISKDYLLINIDNEKFAIKYSEY